MNKYLVFAFLIGFNTFSSFYPVQAMEEELREETSSNPIYIPQRYVVSLEEDAPGLYIAELRTQHRIDNIIAYDDLDAKLYGTPKEDEKLEYNTSFDKVREAIQKLKSIVRKVTIFEIQSRHKVEQDALAHLFLAIRHLLEGTNGMPQNRSYGIELMSWYISQITIVYRKHYQDYLKKFSTVDSYSLNDFIKDCQEKRLKPSNNLMERLLELSPADRVDEAMSVLIAAPLQNS